MNQQQRTAYMQAMGIPVWVPRQVSESSHYVADSEDMADAVLESLEIHQEEVPVVTTDTSEAEVIKPITTNHDLGWDDLQAQIPQCQRCEIAKYRTQTVFGVGNQQADWMIVGEAPGADEDRQGEPFVGKAGQLLTNILAAVNLPRTSVYIANVLKCRPPNNRDPNQEEIANCEGYLLRQIELVDPAVIVIVGRIAAQTLLQTKQPVGRLRGKVHRLPGLKIPVVVTYHPAYLLRQPTEKRKVWEDLKLARQVYDPLTVS
jgi:DNA polymerase